MTAEDSTVSLELGGQQLRDAAHAAAGAHVDQHYPWDGTGDEPEQRVSAYISVLWEWVERAVSRTREDLHASRTAR
jgi:hypothetical protein